MGSIGLAVTSALSISSWLQQAVRQSTEVENLMIPLDRLLAYCNLELEADVEFEKGINVYYY